MSATTKKINKTYLLWLYMNQCLTESLKGLSDEELADCERGIVTDDIFDQEVIILDAIRTEREYRKMNPILAEKKVPGEGNKTIVENYNRIAGTVSQDDAAFAVNYLLGLDINPEEILSECPMMLSIDNFSRLYGFLTNSGWDEDAISTMLITDPKIHKSSLELLKAISKKGNDYPSTLTDERFKTFVKKSAARLTSNKQTSVRTTNK